MRKAITRNKENMIADVKKKFHFDPNKNQPSKARISLKSRSQTATNKGSSCTFSTVKPQNQQTNNYNDSSWLSKLVNNINEQIPVPSSSEEQKSQPLKQQKIINQQRIKKNQSVGNIMQINRKNQIPAKKRKSSFQGQIQKSKRSQSRKMSGYSIQDSSNVMRIKNQLSEGEKIKRNSSLIENQKVEEKQKSLSIQNYSTIKDKEETQVIDNTFRNYQLYSDENIPQENPKPEIKVERETQRVGMIKRNKTKPEVKLDHIVTLEDYSAVTIKKQDEVSQKVHQPFYKKQSSLKSYNNYINKENQPFHQNAGGVSNINSNIMRNKKPIHDNYRRYVPRPNYSYHQNAYNERNLRHQQSKKNIQRNKNTSKQEKNIKNDKYFPLFPEMDCQGAPNKNPYLEMPSIPYEQLSQELNKHNSIKNIEDLGMLLDNINKKLSLYIEKNHLEHTQQQMELNFAELRRNMKY